MAATANSDVMPYFSLYHFSVNLHTRDRCSKKLYIAERRLLMQAGAVLLLQKLFLESKQGIRFRRKKKKKREPGHF